MLVFAVLRILRGGGLLKHHVFKQEKASGNSNTENLMKCEHCSVCVHCAVAHNWLFQRGRRRSPWSFLRRWDKMEYQRGKRKMTRLGPKSRLSRQPRLKAECTSVVQVMMMILVYDFQIQCKMTMQKFLWCILMLSSSFRKTFIFRLHSVFFLIVASES